MVTKDQLTNWKSYDSDSTENHMIVTQILYRIMTTNMMIMISIMIMIWLWLWHWIGLWLWIQIYYETDYDNDHNEESNQKCGLYGQIEIYKHHYDIGCDWSHIYISINIIMTRKRYKKGSWNGNGKERNWIELNWTEMKLKFARAPARTGIE